MKTFIFTIAVLFSTAAFAHNGGLSPKDQCHKQKSVGERHWHEEGTSTRGGPCIKKNGETYKLTNNNLCAAVRIRIIDAGWNEDWKDIAEDFVDCIVEIK